MQYHLYLRNGLVLIPTTGLVHKGLHRDIEPVATAAVSDGSAIRRALQTAFARGNPPTPPYPRGNCPQPVVLKPAGVKTWSAFARHASPWTIKENDGAYEIVGYRMGSNGWEEDPKQKTTLPAGSTMDGAIDRMIAILQDAAGE